MPSRVDERLARFAFRALLPLLGLHSGTVLGHEDIGLGPFLVGKGRQQALAEVALNDLRLALFALPNALFGPRLDRPLWRKERSLCQMMGISCSILRPSTSQDRR